MDEKILVPDFSLDKEPTLKSTRAKNERGLCCFHKCDNKLSEKGYYYYGFKMCEKCGKRWDRLIRKMRREVQAEWDREILDRLIREKNYEML